MKRFIHRFPPRRRRTSSSRLLALALYVRWATSLNTSNLSKDNMGLRATTENENASVVPLLGKEGARGWLTGGAASVPTTPLLPPQARRGAIFRTVEGERS
jgi:hypothetical protein